MQVLVNYTHGGEGRRLTGKTANVTLKLNWKTQEAYIDVCESCLHDIVDVFSLINILGRVRLYKYVSTRLIRCFVKGCLRWFPISLKVVVVMYLIHPDLNYFPTILP